MSVNIIGDRLGVAHDFVYARIAMNDIPARRVGRLWKCKVTEADGWARHEGADDTAKPSRVGGC